MIASVIYNTELKNVVLGLADSASSEIPLEMQYFRSTPDLLNQFLYFKMPPIIYIHIRKLKNTRQM